MCGDPSVLSFFMGLSLEDMEKDKKYKDSALATILQNVCAMLNTGPGKLTIKLVDCVVEDKLVDKYHRMIEQRLKDMVGETKMLSLVRIERKNDTTIVLQMKKSDSFICCAYNLCFPLQTQVIVVSSWETVEKMATVTNTPKIKLNFTMTFEAEKRCSLKETDTVQLKNVKSKSTKNVTVVKRIFDNKLSHYISAFANHRGGHIYFGITDDGIVKGVHTDQTDKIENAIEKLITKDMVWSRDDDQPIKGKHWEVKFCQISPEHVYVIVIYVAAYPGYVFFAEPEGYEVVGNKVKRVGTDKWKAKLPYIVRREPIAISRPIKRCSWSSKSVERGFERWSDLLQTLIDDCKWEDFHDMVNVKNSNKVIQLVISFKQAVAFYRMSRFQAAQKARARFEKMLASSDDPAIFETINQYLKMIYLRYDGHLEESVTAYQDVKQKADMVQPCLVTAEVYVFGVTLYSVHDPNFSYESTLELVYQAMEHLKFVGVTEKINDLEVKTHIYCALAHLGCSLTRMELERKINGHRLHAADEELKKVPLLCSLSEFRDLQFKLAQSASFYRHWQAAEPGSEKKIKIEEAIETAARVQTRAKEDKLDELFRFASTLLAVYTEEMVCAHFATTVIVH